MEGRNMDVHASKQGRRGGNMVELKDKFGYSPLHDGVWGELRLGSGRGFSRMVVNKA